MNKFKVAAEQLLARRHAGCKAQSLESDIRPRSLEDALTIHQEMMNLKPVGGWKCLLPLSEQQLIVAPIFSEAMQKGAECALLADEDKVLIEPEIAFVLGKDLSKKDSGYSEQEIFDAISTTHMALELMQRRYAADSDAEFVDKLADCLVNQGMYIGPEIDKQTAFDTSEIQIKVSQGSDVQNFDGKHPNPKAGAPLSWFINFITERGVELKAGQAIITGSFCGIVETTFDKATDIEYQGVGQYRVTFKAKA